MKSFLRVIGTIIAWIILGSIVAIVGNFILKWFASAFNTDSTLGSILFIVIAMPVVAGVNFWLCLILGLTILKKKGEVIPVLIFVVLSYALSLLSNLSNITNWVSAVASIFAFVVILLGINKDAQTESN